MEIVKFLFSLKGFWALVFQLILALVFYFVPNFPKDVVARSTVTEAKAIKARRGKVF